jgi:acyl-CoA synthetase (AMP-forming)/AMP-acid ligase II
MDRLNRLGKHRDGTSGSLSGSMHCRETREVGRASIADRRQEIASGTEAEELLAFYEGKIAKWWTPDDVIFVDMIPLGATGKVQKNRLREHFGDHLMARAAA